MAGSYLILGQTQKERHTKIDQILLEVGLKNHANNSDISNLEKLEDKKSIGIAEAREASKWLDTKPFAATHKALIIHQANLLTNEAQNALLKTLEEPPAYALIILEAKNSQGFLPTLLSRCRQIKLSATQKTEEATKAVETSLKYKDFLKMTTGQRLDWCAETYKEEREVVVELLEAWLLEMHTDKIFQAENTQLVMKIKKDLENTNVNQRLALELLSLKLIQ